MEYFNLLEFKKEPFSNSPEPEFLFASLQHNTCLQRLELAVRLRRGLNVVIGAVGTGKTTLCRKLIQNLCAPGANDASDIETYLLLDPAVPSQVDFVKTVASILGIEDLSSGDSQWHIKEKIKTFLFEKGIQDQKNIVLIIDEGQKIPDDCLEILREFLNYETNSYKLLQIVIFAQPEFRKNLVARANLFDRVNYLYHLQPLSLAQTKAMVNHRISVASMEPDRPDLFTPAGILAVYLATSGYPRKIVSLCHQVMLLMIIRGKNKAGWFLVRRSSGKMNGIGLNGLSWTVLGMLILAVGVAWVAMNWPEPSGIENPAAWLPVLSGGDLQKENWIYGAAFPGGSKKKSGVPDGHLRQEAAKGTTSARPPDFLGSITLKKGMVIWKIFENIYGNAGDDIAARFMDVNPQIKNLDDTREGTVIHLPAIPAPDHPLNESMIRVSLHEGKDLSALYEVFVEKKHQTTMPPMQLLSLWTPKTGKRFMIVLDRYFRTVEEAEAAIRQLPQEYFASARILMRWEEGTIFFNHRIIGS